MKGAAPLLAFDFGLRRIGVAVGHPLTGGARPLAVVAGGERPDWDAIAALIASWQPGTLVVGHPTRLDGGHSALTEAAERFARRLHGRFGLRVHLADERLSSREAETRLRGARAAGRRRRVRTGETDAVAAQVILEAWMEETACA